MSEAKPLPKGIRLAAIVIGAVVVAALAILHLASAYYVEAGGRAKDDPVAALDYLHRAIEWQPNNAQAYRLMGSVYRANGDWSAAIEALQRYIELRPHNPLGHIELAETYEMAQSQMGAAEAQDLSARIIDEWHQAGLTAQDFILRGDQERDVGQYDEALAWYQRAAQLEPELGDPWYYMGLVYDKQAQPLQSLEAYKSAISASRFLSVDRSSPYYRLGVVYQSVLNPPQPDRARVAFDAALAADDFTSVEELADCHYRLGYALRTLQAEPETYITEFRKAIALNPNHTWAHIVLGNALYDQERDASAAEQELLAALQLAPENVWAYYHLAEIYRQEGRTDEAIATYERALEADPGFEAAQQRLSTLREKE